MHYLLLLASTQKCIDTTHSRFLIIFLVLLFDGLLILLALVIVVLLQDANSGLQRTLLLQGQPLGHEGQGDAHESLLPEQLVHQLIHVHDRYLPQHVPDPDLTVVVVEWLQGLVGLDAPQDQPQIEQGYSVEVLVVAGLEVLQGDFLGQVHLQQFEHQAQELGGLLGAAVEPPDVPDLDRLVDKGLGVEGEALLFPVPAIEYVMTGELVDQLHALVVCHGSIISSQPRLQQIGANDQSMGAQQVQAARPTSKLEKLVIRRNSEACHSLHSPRVVSRDYVWRRWHFGCQAKALLKLSELEASRNQNREYFLGVLQADLIKSGKDTWEVKAKIQYSDNSLKSRVDHHARNSLTIPEQQILQTAHRMCDIAGHAARIGLRLPQQLSHLVYIGHQLKAKDPKLLPNIKLSKAAGKQHSISQVVCRLMANLCLLLNVGMEFEVLGAEISSIHSKYGGPLAGLITQIQSRELSYEQIVGVLHGYGQGYAPTNKLIQEYRPDRPQKLKIAISQSKACPISQSTITELRNKAARDSEIILNKCISEQKIPGRTKRREQIYPKQRKLSFSLNRGVACNKENRENRENGGSRENKENVSCNKAHLEIEDHNFPKKVKQFRKTSVTLSDDTFSRNMSARNSEARNQQFIKLTGGQKCELFNQNSNESLLQSIIESEESIIVRDPDSPVLNLDHEIELITQDLQRLQEGFQNCPQQELKSILEYVAHRNSTIIELTEQNEQSKSPSGIGLGFEINNGSIRYNSEEIKSELCHNERSISRFEAEKDCTDEQCLEEQKFVVQHYEGGSRYQGYTLNGLRHGFGKLFYQDGGSYEGCWQRGEICGFGKLYYQSGQLAYQGYWQNGEFHGEGKIINETPEPLHQEFNYENLSELGTCWIEYEGNFEADHKHGLGTLVLSNGEQFTGTWQQNNVEGEGVFTTKSGQQIKGIWANNQLVKVWRKELNAYVPNNN